MTGKLGDQHLDTLERQFQALREQAGGLPEAWAELETAFQEVSQAIAAVRAAREAERRPPGDKPGGRKVKENPGSKDSPGSIPAGSWGQTAAGWLTDAPPPRCETILSHVFEAIPDLLTVHDREFNTLMSNWHGYESVSETERQGQPKCYRVYHHRDRPCEPCHALEVLATGLPARVEKVNPVNGRVREVNAFPIKDESGRVVMVAEHVRDITERHLAEEALAESEKRFRMLFEYAPDSYILSDAQGKIIDCNKGTEDLTGYGREELIGSNFASLPLLNPRQQIRLAELLAQGVHGEVLGPVEFTLTRKDGGEVRVEGKSLPLNIQGRTLLLAIARDITARKLAEKELFKNHLELQEIAQRLEQSRNMLQLIIESIPVRVFWKDSDLRFLGCNTLFARDAGLNDPQQLLGQDDFVMGWKEQAHLYRMDDRQVMESLRPKMNIVEPQTTPTGAKIWLKTSKVPLQMPNGEVFGVLGVYEDITTHKQAEAALRESEATLRTLIEANPETLFLLDTRGTILAASRVAAQRLDKNLGEIIGADAFALVPPQVGKKRFEIFQQVVATGSPVRFEDVRGDLHLDISMNPIFCQDEVVQVAVLGVDISLKKRAEQSLKESEERFRAVFEFAPVGISMTDLAGSYLQTNQALQQILGYTAEELRGINFKEITHPEDLPENLRLRETLLGGQCQHYSMEKRYRRKDGDIVWGRMMVALLHDVQSQPQYLISTVVDITARKQAEEALRESEARYRTLFEASPDAINVMDLDMKFIMGNQRGVEMFGLESLEQAKSRKGIDFIAPEDRPRVMAAIEELLKTGQTQTFEISMIKSDGARFPSLTSAALTRDAAGRPQAIIGIARDITALKQAEVELRESEQRFRLMAETIQDVFWIGTPEIGKILYVSPGYESIWGRTCEELYRDPKIFIESIHPEDRERVRSEVLAGHNQGVSWSHDYRIIKPDGTVRWIQDRGFPVRDDQGRVILFTGVARDITGSKALEQQLLQAQKMEAVGRLAGGVAHDFNNLLMAITGYGELMRTKVLRGDPLYSHLENILKAADRAAALTQQLLTFSRRQIVHPQVIDLNQVVRDLEPMLRRLIGEDLDLEIITESGPAAVKADPGHLGQIIMNLVVNGRDAMPKGGRLTLKTAPADFNGRRNTRFGPVPPGAYARLEVRDTGVGMDDATQTHVFEPFFTTKEPGKGTGLGLSTVYGIVKQSGGYLDLASEPEAGSTFTIYLPRLEAIVEPPKARIPITASFRGEETILLVEDEDVLRGLLAKFLRIYGYTVLEARHGGEALLTCERHPGPIHVMVTDVVMPQMSGRELAERLAPLRPDMKVLYMSGYTEDTLVQQGVADLSVPFLQKPFRPIDLARRVHAVLNPPVGN